MLSASWTLFEMYFFTSWLITSIAFNLCRCFSPEIFVCSVMSFVQNGIAIVIAEYVFLFFLNQETVTVESRQCHVGLLLFEFQKFQRGGWIYWWKIHKHSACGFNAFLRIKAAAGGEIGNSLPLWLWISPCVIVCWCKMASQEWSLCSSKYLLWNQVVENLL